MAKKDVKEQLRGIIQRELDACMGTEGDQLSSSRERLKMQYLGYGYDVDDDRRKRSLSTYVDRTVMETVEWAKPGLMRVFCSSDDIIRFDPKSPEQEQAADDATLYVNQVVFGRNIFRLVHDVLADGLYQRVGWCLAHCPEEREQRVLQYTGLAEQEAVALLSDPSIDLEKDTVDVQRYETPQGMLYDLDIHQEVITRDIRIEPVPSEHVVISSDAADVESARFVAWWQVRTASDLRKEGYSAALIAELPSMDDADEMPETEVGRAINSDSDEETGGHGATRRIRVWEGWFDADLNGDGIAEKVKAIWVGDGERCKILKYEEWPLYRAPLFAACSVPMPHQVIGLCVADLVADVQDLRSETMRQMLDNLALSNQGELVVNEGMSGDVEYDSLLARGVGAVHRIKGDATITPLPVMTSSGDALQAMSLTDQITERRTGISSRTQSLQADTLQNTATGANIMEEAINQRLELVARVYAESFFKPLGRYVLHLLHKYHDKAIQLRIKGKFMAFDPSTWDPDMDISVAVGLGTGNRTRLLAVYQQILSLQQQFVTAFQKNSPVRLSNIIYTCHKMAEAAGLEAPERFFGTEDDARKAEKAIMEEKPQPSPEAQKLELEKQKAQAKMALDKQKAQTEAQRKAWEAQTDAALEEMKIKGQLALKVQEMEGEKQLDAMKMALGQAAPGLTDLRGAQL